MSDPLELETLFGSASNYVDESMYDRINYLEVSDEQNGVYGTGQLSYNTDNHAKHHIVYSESYLTLPIETTMTTPGRLAVKNSILSFIQGVNIETSSGSTIVSEHSSTPIIANLRLLLDSSIDFIQGNELMYYGPDKTVEEDASGAHQSVVGGAHGDVSTGEGLVLDALDFRKNPRLCNRITVLANREEVTAAAVGPPAVLQTRKFVAYIPLRFVHDLFAQMNFPITNLSMRMAFNIAGTGSYKAFSPWSTPRFPAHSTMGDTAAPVALKRAEILAVPAAEVAIASTLAPAVPTAVVNDCVIIKNFVDRFGGVHAPRLFLKAVTFRAAEAQALKAKIVAGFSKQLTYRVSTLYQHQLPANGSGSDNWAFGQAIIRPTRLWAFPLERDANGKPALESTLNTFPSRIGRLALQDTNIVLNGDNFYNHSFKTQYDYFREFKTQLIGASSSQAAATPVTFSDWISGFNPYCFDLSRNATVRSNGFCSMALVTNIIDQTTKAPATMPVDLYVIVERLQTVTFKVSEGGVEVLVKHGADA